MARSIPKMRNGQAVILAMLAWMSPLMPSAVSTAVAGVETNGALGRLLGAKGNGISQSVLVVRLSDGKAMFERDPDQLVAPASVTKVVTSAAVLARFSPVHTFTTSFYYSGTRHNERVNGDLIVVGDGDPFLVSEKLWQVAADLRHMGIREFTGDLVIDNSLFDREERDDSRQDGVQRSSHAYDAPVSAFAVNFNTFAVVTAPAVQAGKPALVSLDPYPLRGVILEDNVRTVQAGAGKSVQVSRMAGGKQGDRLVVSGGIGLDTPLVKVYRSVGEPRRASGEYVKAFLRNEGITVRGEVRDGRLPANVKPLLAVESYEMRRIVAGLNTFSNNFIADVLVKRLGAAFPRQGPSDAPGSGTFANGVAVLSDFLKSDVGITTPFVIENGSGLATENRLTARQIVQVLAFMEKRMDLFPEFLASLPATGWDGTLKKRFAKGAAEDLKGLFRAKSGTLTEPITVAGLAGYFRHPKHGMMAFCLMENGVLGRPQPAITELRDRQDQALVAMLNEL